MPPKLTADNCQPCQDRKKSCSGGKPAPTCLRSANGKAEYEKQHGVGSAATAIAAWNVQRAKKGQEQISLVGATSGDHNSDIAPAVIQKSLATPHTSASFKEDKRSDLEEMLKPLPFYDEIEGTCEWCQEPPTSPSTHAMWCHLNPLSKKS